MRGDTTLRVSDGVLVAPFLDTAVAVDLVTERAHVLSEGAALLMTQDQPASIDTLLSEVPEDQREPMAGMIDETLATLRASGLIDRAEDYDWLEPFAQGGGPTPGGHVGPTHAVIDQRIAFRSDDAALLGQVEAVLGDSVDEPATRFFDLVPDAASGKVTLYAADEWTFADEDQLLSYVPVVLNDDGSHTHGTAVIHSGVVRTPDGRVVMLTGPPDAGKSTLVGALVAAGCDYLGDESVGITPAGTLWGYPKPLTLSAASREVLGLEPSAFPHVRIEALRGDVERVAGAQRIDEILLVRYDSAHTGMMSGRPLEPVPALEAVLANVLNLARAGESGLEAICNLVESVPVVPFTHPGVDQAVPVILGI